MAARVRIALLRLLLAAIVLAPSLTHADIPLELRGQRVVDVEVAGVTAGLTPDREVGIPLGVPLTRQLVRSATLRLSRSGRWADVQIDAVAVPGGVKLVAHLTPQVVLQRVEVQGNEVIDGDELLRAMEVSSGTELRDESLVRMSRAAEDLYAQRGYLASRAQMILRDTDDPARKVLVVQITEGRPTRVAQLVFEGPAPAPESGAYDELEIEVGDVIDAPRIEQLVEQAELAMRRRGWLEADLGPPRTTPVGTRRVALVVPSAPGPRYEVVIRGHRPLERTDVEDALELGEERLVAPTLDAIRERVADVYQRHGFLSARVWVTRAVTEEDRAELRIDVVPGPQLEVVEIRFPGARHFEQGLLRDQVYAYLEEDLPGSSFLYPVDTETADVLVGGDPRFRREVPRPLVVEPRKTYYEPTYAEAVEHVRELYQAEGFLGARVGPAAMRRLDHPPGESARAVVDIPVVEGPRTTLHRVQLEGNEVLGARAILTAAGLEGGQPFSYLSLEQSRLAVLELYRDRGYLYARVDPSVRFSADRTRAEVTFQIVERFPVHVGEIVVRGALRTSESLIRDRITLSQGGVYRPALARESQERLLELGIFSGVNVAPQDADLPARVKPVVVTVTERPGQFLDFSAGVSTGEGGRAGFEYGYRNLFGYAVTLSLRVQLAFQFIFVEETLERRFEQLPLEDRLERSVTAGVTVPHLALLPYVRWNLDFVHLRDNERDFGLDKNGVVLSATWRPSRRFALTVAENLENNNVDLLVDVENLNEYLRNNDDPRLERLLRVPEGESTLLATQVSASLDFRDSPFTPTRGWFAGMRAEWARTLETESQLELDRPFESHFLKVGITTSGYIPLAQDLVWATQLRFGRILHLDPESRTYPNRSFYLGGVDTMRGFFQDALIPQDLADEIASDPELSPNDVVRGGDTFVLVRTELRFPIAGVFHGGVFADIGNLWADAAKIEPLDLRPTGGVGLRIATPVGPLALDVGFNPFLREALNEPFWTVHFAIGLF